MTGRPVDQTHNHFLGNIISPPDDRLSLSGIQQITLLGPYRVEFDEPFIEVGSSVGSVPENALVIRVFAIPVTEWESAPSGFPVLKLGIGRPVVPLDGNWWSTSILFEASSSDIDPGAAEVLNEYALAAAARTPYSQARVAGVTLLVNVYDGDDASAPTAGAMDVYALIAQPA